jgi:hypothetical protein
MKRKEFQLGFKFEKNHVFKKFTLLKTKKTYLINNKKLLSVTKNEDISAIFMLGDTSERQGELRG